MSAGPGTPATPSSSSSSSAGAGSAGRGVLLIAFAKLYFMVAGLVIQFRLPAILSAAVFGAYQVVNSVVSPFNNVMITGSVQAVSRFAAQTPERARLVEHAGLRMHLFVGLPVAVAFVAAAPVVAWLLHDPSKTVPLMLAGLIVGLYSFYAVLVGTANGLRQFHKQAGLDITFATLRTIGLLGMAMAGLGVAGVIGGWIIAAAVILLVAAVWIGLPRLPAGGERVPVRPLITYFAGIALYLILFNALMFVDTWLLKRLVTVHYREQAVALGAALDQVLPWARQVTGYHYDPSQLADVQVAYYGAAQQLGRLSYQVIIAGMFVVFPLVSRSTFEGDRASTGRYIHVTMRYSLIVAMAIAVVLAANPQAILDLPYATEYAVAGGPALVALALGTVAFSLFAIAGTILNGAGQSQAAIACALVTLAVAAIGNFIVIPRCEPGREVLVAAATVTGVSMLIGALTTGWVLVRRFGAFLPVLSALRVGAASAVAIGVGRVLPAGGPLMTLVEAAATGVVYLGVLLATGELGKKDLAAIAAVRRSRAPGGGEP
jgi:stage V sporulation protein B